MAHQLSQEARKSWAYDNLQRDSVPGAAARNVRIHGARRIHDMLGPVTWTASYGQSPFDDTFALAVDIDRGEAIAIARDAIAKAGG